MNVPVALLGVFGGAGVGLGLWWFHQQAVALQRHAEMHGVKVSATVLEATTVGRFGAFRRVRARTESGAEITETFGQVDAQQRGWTVGATVEVWSVPGESETLVLVGPPARGASPRVALALGIFIALLGIVAALAV